jgi:hypothetical protein
MKDAKVSIINHAAGVSVRANARGCSRSCKNKPMSTLLPFGAYAPTLALRGRQLRRRARGDR